MRVLAKLPVDAEVEYGTGRKAGGARDQRQGHRHSWMDLSLLTADQRNAALKRLNEESCDCGCGLTIAACRINDSTCAVSPKLAERIVADVKQASK